MPRPRKLRSVQGRPIVDAFLPNRMPPWGREEVILSIEGLEAIRLSDFQGLDQDTAASLMNVSRQTFGRVLSEARQLVAEGLVMGKMIRIQGGSYALAGVSSSGGRGGPHGRHRRGRGGSRPY